MTPTQFRTALDQLGLSQASAARFLSVSIRTANGWANANHPIPEAVAKLPRLMIKLNLKPGDVR